MRLFVVLFVVPIFSATVVGCGIDKAADRCSADFPDCPEGMFCNGTTCVTGQPPVDAGPADGPSIRDTGTADRPPVSDTITADGPVDMGNTDVRVDAGTDGPVDVGNTDLPVDVGPDAPADQGADSADTIAPPTACVFDDPNALFGSCLFDP